MSHPLDLGRTLEDLDREWLRALDHLLQCPECSRRAQQFLQEEIAEADALSADQLDSLSRLSRRVQRNLDDVRRFVRSLTRERKRASLLVRSRLECLVTDHLAPAVKDLASIEKDARGHLDPGDAR
jgi:hypothetical protein